MKLIVVRGLDGAMIGQCTARCYDAAPGSRCACVCGGKNHGMGEDHALASALELASGWKTARVEVDPRANQLFLIDPRCEKTKAD